MSGERPSVRLPSRTVPICVRLPIGFASPRRIASTPAMKVVATAPMPGSSTPSFPLAGAIGRPLVAFDINSPPLRLLRVLPNRDPITRVGTRASHARADQTASPLRLVVQPAALAQECERGVGQLVVVARTDETPLG